MNFHSHSFSLHNPTSLNFIFFCSELVNYLFNLSLRVESPHHTLFQNKILLPEPTFQNTIFQTTVCSIPDPTNQSLNLIRFFIPNPPSSLFLCNVFHLTHDTFFPSCPHPHKNFLCMLITYFLTPNDILKIDRKYKDKAEKINLIRDTLPVSEMKFHFHLDVFFLIFWIITDQNSFFL